MTEEPEPISSPPPSLEPVATTDVETPGNRPASGLGTTPDASTAPKGCTVAQLRRFIKSRPYVPMHELRRRFELNGALDEVTPIHTADGTVYVGLPQRESAFIADLVKQGDVGLELCWDPIVPMVVGVYAMRPITRQ